MTDDNARAAEALYNHPAPGSRDRAAADHPAAATAKVIYDGNAAPAPIAPPVGQFYARHHLANTIGQRDAELFEVLGETARERANTTRFWDDVAAKTGLPETVVARLADAEIDLRLKAARDAVSPDPAARDAELAQRIQADNEKVRSEMRLRHGREADSLLDRARRFARTHRGLVEMLDRDGLGSQPAVVEAFVEHVIRTGWR